METSDEHIVSWNGIITPPNVPAKPDKGKGRQHATLTPSSSRSVDPQSTAAPTDSVNLTPEQHLCLVQVLKCLDEWFAQGWEPGVDKSRLRALAEIFNSAESVAEGSLSNIRCADLAWRLSDSEGWEKSAGSSIMGAIDVQKLNWVTAATLQAYQDHLFRKKRVEEICSQTYQRGFDSKGWTAQLEELATYMQNSMKEADYLLTRRMPRFLRMMKHARTLPNTSPLLAERLTGNGSTSCSSYESLPPEPTLFVPTTPLVHSLTACLPPSSSSTNYDTFLRVVDASPTPTPSEDFDAFGATPSVTGLPTMTELINQYMQDQLTLEFCLVVLAEDS
ncbi:hypothetical protein SCLCIDRAFT_23172 [Scleroderma citrinum Foug A]|uniref:Uncharacterized protein n=1 Tax=Scleroderma citrinum Foug A TaxID=1036808 RepID=A0A0C3E8K4_9AGAM|nr:hypothetical protein SCLCIDRAFT_23172 [Scleroderma citrinum Foug A]